MADDFAPMRDATLASCNHLFAMLPAYLLKINDASRVLFVADGAAYSLRCC